MNGEVVGNQQLGLIVGMLFVWIGLLRFLRSFSLISPGKTLNQFLHLSLQALEIRVQQSVITDLQKRGLDSILAPYSYLNSHVVWTS